MIRSYLRRIGIGIEDRKHKVHRGSTYHRPRHSIISGNGEMAGRKELQNENGKWREEKYCEIE